MKVLKSIPNNKREFGADINIFVRYTRDSLVFHIFSRVLPDMSRDICTSCDFTHEDVCYGTKDPERGLQLSISDCAPKTRLALIAVQL